MKLSIKDKRQVALAIHTVVLWLSYYFIYIFDKSCYILIILHIATLVLLFFILNLSIIMFSMIWEYFFIDDNLIYEEKKEAFDKVHFPTFLLKIIDFMSFGAAKDFYDAFS